MAKKVNKKIVRRNKDVIKKKKKDETSNITFKKFLFIVMALLFIGGTLYTFLCSNLVQINNISIKGVKRVDEEQIISIVENVNNEEIVYCINKNNYFFIDVKKIKEEILKDKRIQSVEIFKNFPSALIVDIVENDVIQVWCKGADSGRCFVVKDEKISYEVNMNDNILSENKYFVVIDETDGDIEVGDRVMSQKNLDKIELLGEELIYALNTGINKQYRVISIGSNEVHFKTDEGWTIIVDITSETDEILEVASLFVKKVELPGGRDDLEYVDMRFPEKIFYKMKDGVEQIEDIEETEKNKNGGEDQEQQSGEEFEKKE